MARILSGLEPRPTSRALSKQPVPRFQDLFRDFLEGAFCMNPISNAWNHPKTSAAGLLIAVITIAGIFSQQGVTLGAAGTGTVVTLVGAIATALLGLLARDPGASLLRLEAPPNSAPGR
jgi:hypothetical protein